MESLAGHTKPEALKFDAVSSCSISCIKKSLDSKYYSKLWHKIRLPSLKCFHIKTHKYINYHIIFYYYSLVKLFRLHRFSCSLRFLVWGHWETWTVVNLSQFRAAEDVPM